MYKKKRKKKKRTITTNTDDYCQLEVIGYCKFKVFKAFKYLA